MEYLYGLFFFLTMYLLLYFDDKYLTKKYWKEDFKDSPLVGFIYGFVVLFVYPLSIVYILLALYWGCVPWDLNDCGSPVLYEFFE